MVKQGLKGGDWLEQQWVRAIGVHRPHLFVRVEHIESRPALELLRHSGVGSFSRDHDILFGKEGEWRR